MPEPPIDPLFTSRVGDVFQINDTRGIFIVIELDNQYATVIDQAGHRPRRILRRNLRPSSARHGYTLLERRGANA